MKFNFKVDDLSLLKGIEILKEYYDIELGEEGRTLEAKHCEIGMRVTATKSKVVIEYASKNLFFMGFSYCMQNYEKDEFVINRNGCVERLGIMRDCARNAIISCNGCKDLIVYMAMLGYNYLELYVEDLLEVEDLPYLGHARGRYKQSEIKAIDEIGNIFGVELVPCIQTLAHLPAIFRHDVFAPINDINDILLVDDEKTYDFIEKIIKFVSESYSSKRINIGMDEAHAMCMGAYLNKNGYEKDRGKVFLKHLSRVLEICKKYGFKASMWSDMFFKIGLNITAGQSYVQLEGKEFTEEFKKNIPADVTLIFWDYYHTDKQFYDDVFKKHFELTNNVSFAGGCWTWTGFAPQNSYAERTLLPAIESCKEYNCKDFMVTSWGDGGGESSCFMPISTYLKTSELLYDGYTIEAELNTRAEFIFGNTYDELKNIEIANRTAEDSIKKAALNGKLINPSKYLFYNDPLCGILDCHCYTELRDAYKNNSIELKKYSEKNGRFSYLFDTLYKLSYCLEEKATLGIDLTNAYKNNDRAMLKEIATKRISTCKKRAEDFYYAFKKQWLKENKSFGFEITDLRIGTTIFRLEQTANKVIDYLDGKIDKIEELEQKRLPVCSFMKEKEDICYNYFQWNITGSII